MNNESFEIERTFNAPIHRVWRAITDKNAMKEWFFELVEFIPEVGFEFRFWGGTPERQYLHICKITDIEVGRKLAYTWRYDGVEGISKLVFELHAEGNKTLVKLTHEGLESFPHDNPDLAAKNFAEGWTYLMDKSLKEFLETRP
jgi:uncharacterized protein YndB with AHSA1/START domain